MSSLFSRRQRRVPIPKRIMLKYDASCREEAAASRQSDAGGTAEVDLRSLSRGRGAATWRIGWGGAGARDEAPVATEGGGVGLAEEEDGAAEGAEFGGEVGGGVFGVGIGVGVGEGVGRGVGGAAGVCRGRGLGEPEVRLGTGARALLGSGLLSSRRRQISSARRSSASLRVLWPRTRSVFFPLALGGGFGGAVGFEAGLLGEVGGARCSGFALGDVFWWGRRRRVP